MITVVVASGTAITGFGAGLFYAARRMPRWLAEMTDAQLDTLITKAEQIRTSA